MSVSRWSPVFWLLTVTLTLAITAPVESLHGAGDLAGRCLGSGRPGEPKYDDQRDDDSYCCFHGEFPPARASRSGRRATSPAGPRTPSAADHLIATDWSFDADVERSQKVERSLGSRLLDGNNNRIRCARSTLRDVLTSRLTRRKPTGFARLGPCCHHVARGAAGSRPGRRSASRNGRGPPQAEIEGNG